MLTASAEGRNDTPSPTAKWGREARATFRLAWPLIIAQLAQMALLTTDVVMTGWLGPTYLAAATLAVAFLHPFLLFGVGVLSAVAPMIARAIGARDLRSARRSVRQGFWVTILIAGLMIPVIWQVRPILLALGQDAEISRLAEEYLHAAVWLLFPSLMFIVTRSFLAAHGKTRVVLAITVACIFVNALGNYALMFGNFGFPRLELQGGGISTVVANTAMFALTLGYILIHRRYRRYALLGRLWRPDWQRFAAILKIGVPIGLMLAAEVGMFAGVALLMGWLGTAELAAHAVALQWAALSFMVPLGLSHATTVRVGLAHGRHDAEAIGRAGWTSIAIGTGFMSVMAAAFLLVPGTLVGLFLDPTDPVNAAPAVLAVSYLSVAALFQLADGAQVVSSAALRGLGDTSWPMVIAIAGYWACGIPVAWLCGFVLDMRGIGIWLGLAAGLFFVAATLIIRFALRERLGLTRPVAE